MKIAGIVLALFLMSLNSVASKSAAPAPAAEHVKISPAEPFGKTPDGQQVEIYTITNSHGMEVRAMTYGGIIVSIKTPDKTGKLADVVLGFDDLDGYIKSNKPYFGAIIGRYANRIAGGTFKIDGKEYHTPVNNGNNTLHGGLKGFDKVVWHAEPFHNAKSAGVVLTYTSKDGEEGFPGDLKCKITYELNDANELTFRYEATTDKPTVLNLTQHSYFNLAGEGNGDILGHDIMLNADNFTPVNKDVIPTGEVRSVKGTPLDLTHATKIGTHINDDYDQLKIANGYDHNFVINSASKGGHELKLAARVHDPESGRILEVRTTEPGIQFYAGNFLDGSSVGKHGHAYKKREGLALEAEHYPDSPNEPRFPTTLLKPGQTFRATTTYKFSAE